MAKRGAAGAIAAIRSMNPDDPWIIEGQVKRIRKDDSGAQIVVEVCPVPDFDPNDESDNCISARWLSPCVQGNSVVYIPPAIGDWVTIASVDGRPQTMARVIGLVNGAAKPIPNPLDLTEAFIKLPDAVKATIQVDEVQIRIDGADITLTTTGNVILDAGAGNVDLRGATVKGTASGSGEAALAKQSSLTALETAYLAHKHTGVTTGPGTSAIMDSPVTPSTGTVNLKGQ